MIIPITISKLLNNYIIQLDGKLFLSYNFKGKILAFPLDKTTYLLLNNKDLHITLKVKQFSKLQFNFLKLVFCFKSLRIFS